MSDRSIITPASTHGAAGDVVPAAAHGDLQALGARQPHGVGDVCRARGSGR